MTESNHDLPPPQPPGTCEQIAPGIARIVAPNPGPMTFQGTCTYLLGEREVTLVDPGPLSKDHLGAIGAALEGRALRNILITHTHRDHSPLAREVKARFGGATLGFGPHQLARALGKNEDDLMRGSGDYDFVPDLVLRDGEEIDLGEWQAQAVHTPGHLGNHLCFALKGSDWLISGDHVMGWNSTIVAPPEGSMGDYMASLDKVTLLQANRYLPGHGDVITEGKARVQALKDHREARARDILAAINQGAQDLDTIVDRVYAGLDVRLKGAARLSALAQLEWMAEQGELSVPIAGMA